MMKSWHHFQTREDVEKKERIKKIMGRNNNDNNNNKKKKKKRAAQFCI